ncbi:hypothetical protein [Sedimentitalea nanhaiensis]|uniref:Uncharacterized protein n=1 Tax=Sedimentitalea nanhaiensis TaxID=999627 RepID=A0A1I7E943_9RHOB|nr:hypothetical protein [Sedimentitalea nanhaiensis]SFU20405.1 hypothetical protein SAMN05216236_15119 [Sedimentitalea nanhaiensis]
MKTLKTACTVLLVFAGPALAPSDEIAPGREFAAWDFGFDFIAEDAGQDHAYETAPA